MRAASGWPANRLKKTRTDHVVIKLTDVRRLTGVNFLMDDTGAVAEAVLPDCRKDVAIKLWQTNMRAVLDGVGWQDQRVVVRGYPGGASTAISAPLDALYAATDLIEVAWQFTEATLNDTALADMDRALASLSGKIAAERSAPLVALAAAAARHDVTFLAHDGGVSVGLCDGQRSVQRAGRSRRGFRLFLCGLCPGRAMDAGGRINRKIALRFADFPLEPHRART